MADAPLAPAFNQGQRSSTPALPWVCGRLPPGYDRILGDPCRHRRSLRPERCLRSPMAGRSCAASRSRAEMRPTSRPSAISIAVRPVHFGLDEVRVWLWVCNRRPPSPPSGPSENRRWKVRSPRSRGWCCPFAVPQGLKADDHVAEICSLRRVRFTSIRLSKQVFRVPMP